VFIQFPPLVEPEDGKAELKKKLRSAPDCSIAIQQALEKRSRITSSMSEQEYDVWSRGVSPQMKETTESDDEKEWYPL
jgi:hypothetical protein